MLRRLLPQKLPIVIEPAQTDDLEAIVAIEQRSYSFPWARKVLQAEINGKTFAHVYVARLPQNSGSPASKLIGYHYFWLVADEIHILNIAVDPDYQGCGCGKQLLQFALDFGQARGAASAFLEVRASNDAAQQLYKACGFQRIGIRKQYYADNNEDAYVMKKQLDGEI